MKLFIIQAIHNFKRSCLFFDPCPDDDYCMPCGYICALVVGYGKRCMQDPNEGPVNDGEYLN